jgi:hypothetical protein
MDRWKAFFQALVAFGIPSTSSHDSGSDKLSSDITSLALSPNP